LVERDGVLFAAIAKTGLPTPVIVAEMVEAIVRGFPWPKSMRWGSGSLRWVRPLQRILCVFDGAVVPFEIDGIVSGDLTQGHRFMGEDRAPFAAHSFDAYAQGLAGHFVVLEAAERKKWIIDGARAACAARGLELVEDEGLLDEVAGLAEWPVPILGDMDPAFLDLPPEVIRTSMRTHQKYFAVRDPKNGALAPHFLVIANIEASDGGDMVAAGNARVLSARLNDARFFWDEDRKPGVFVRWIEKLQGVTFHAKLGTMYERVERITALARAIAPLVGCSPDQVEKAAEAARLCKADLASGMVGEFPELQGIMGGYYARALDLDPEIADAIRDHYRPLGPGDSAPTAPVSVAVALADKLDTLVGFFAIDEKPTGSKDPYALRRAALGVIRLIVSNGVRLPLALVSARALDHVGQEVAHRAAGEMRKWGDGAPLDDAAEAIRSHEQAVFQNNRAELRDSLLAFFADRLKVLLRDQGKRHDLVDAVFALGDDDLVRITARVEALTAFLATEDGTNLLAGHRRAVNILKAEAKKNPGEAYGSAVDPARLLLREEKDLAEAVAQARAALDQQVAAEDFAGAMTSLAALRRPVDAFFDKVLVNDPDKAVRLNRLQLLSQMRDAAGQVADFSLITG
jgi:glycyl-tRNA synthetase beta chain